MVKLAKTHNSGIGGDGLVADVAVTFLLVWLLQFSLLPFLQSGRAAFPLLLLRDDHFFRNFILENLAKVTLLKF